MRSARQISALSRGLRRAKEEGTIHHVLPKKLKVEVPKKPKTTKPKAVEQAYGTTPAVEGQREVTRIVVGKDKDYIVTNAMGYTEEQLNTKLPENDYEFLEAGIRIPANYGMGIEVRYNNEDWVYRRGGHSWRAKPTVTLEISTWLGISCGAMHYYGKLKINFPELTRKDNPNYSTSADIPMLDLYDIELTQVLEQWEKDKYPEHYEYNHVGDHHHGFYTRKQVTEYAKEVFEKIFAEGWNFRIEER